MISCPTDKKTIMFDLHGVLESSPDLFMPLMMTMKACGHTVYVCSGPCLERIKRELDDLGYRSNVHYDSILSVEEYLSDHGVKFTYDEKGNPWTDEETWWSSKGRIASKYKVDLVIDDSIQYEFNMPSYTTFLLMK